jgi:hypothetical protein
MVELLELSSSRIILLALYGFLAIIFLILGTKVSRRGQKTPQTAHIVRFFFFIGFSLVINVLYAPIADEVIQRIGNNSLLLLVTMGVANLMLFTLSVRYSELELTKTRSLLIEICVFVLSAVYYFIPGGTTIVPPDYAPLWSTSFLIYGMILTNFLMFMALVIGFKVRKQMENPALKRKFSLFLIGLLFLEILLITTFLGNGGILVGTLRLLLTLSILPGAFLVYAGVGRPLKVNA